MSTDSDRVDIPDHIALVGEAHDLLGLIRAAADRGDATEVHRLFRRLHDIEIEKAAREYTDVRHSRAQHGRRGFNPDLERVEGQLRERLARAGVHVSMY